MFDIKPTLRDEDRVLYDGAKMLIQYGRISLKCNEVDLLHQQT